MKQLKYKQYCCSYGNVILYEDGTVDFIPFLSVNINETLAMSELEDLDFDNTETCELLAEDVAEFKDDTEQEEVSEEDLSKAAEKEAFKKIWDNTPKR